MAQFEIVETTNPSVYKNEIIDLWDKNLDDTPHDRFGWLIQGNPAGRTIWILAIDKKKGVVAGAVSLMPKEITFKQEALKGLIVGDFMVHDEYRVYGPSIILLKTAIRSGLNKKIDFMYTVPNSASERMIKAVGFKKNVCMITYVKPIRSNYYIQKKFTKKIANAISPVTDITAYGLSIMSYTIFEGSFIQSNKFDKLIDEVFYDSGMDYSKYEIQRLLKYYDWKFFNNPHKRYTLLAYKSKYDNSLYAYAFYCFRKKRMEIDYIFTKNEKYCRHLFKKLVLIALKENVHAITFTVLKNSEWSKKLKYYGFFKSNDRFTIHWIENTYTPLELCEIFNGDRNV